MIDSVKDLLAKQLNIEKSTIEDDSKILDDLGADSLEVVEMLMTIEDRFGITVPDDDVASLKTVRDVANYIRDRV